MKIFNIALLKAKFEFILGGQDFNQSDDIIRIDNRKVSPCLIYENYIYRGLKFLKLSIDKYFQCVNILKRLQQQRIDYEFD